jgi:hypothetical protein
MHKSVDASYLEISTYDTLRQMAGPDFSFRFFAGPDFSPRFSSVQNVPEKAVF